MGKHGVGREAPWIDELRDMWEKRDPHIQKVLEPFFPERPKFDGTQFVCYIVKDLKLRPSGDTELTLTVPFEFRDLAFKLSEALVVPLSVDFQLWKPFEEAFNGSRELAEPTTHSNGKEAS